jgi:hypothetical protein
MAFEAEAGADCVSLGLFDALAVVAAQPPAARGKTRPRKCRSDARERAGEGASRATKNYAVGLENSCPGGAYHWAPEIPSTWRIAGVTPGKCELAHNRGAFFPQLPGSDSAPQPQINRALRGSAGGHNWPAMLVERPVHGYCVY